LPQVDTDDACGSLNNSGTIPPGIQTLGRTFFFRIGKCIFNHKMHSSIACSCMQSLLSRCRRLMVITAFLLSCSSGKQAYERGDYYAAVMQAVARLKQNPDHRKSRETLSKGYPLAVEYFETNARNQIVSNAPDKWSTAMVNYEKLNHMYEAIRQSPGALRVIPQPKSFYAEMAPLRDKAADELYQAGILLLMKGTREDARKAYQKLSEAHKYVPNYKDVVEYMAKAKTEATVFVIVEPVAVPSRYNLSADFFNHKLQEYLYRNFPEQGFVRFFNRTENNLGDLPRIDHVLKLQFDDFSIGNVNHYERVETVTLDSVKVGETIANGKKVPVYNTVSAKLTTFRKEVVSEGTLSMIISEENTGRVLAHRKFPGRHVWSATWAQYSGDERALSARQLEWCKKPEEFPPDPQELFLAVANSTYNQLTNAIRDFYRDE
jgi:tetratricopeptide (TPR) repeat protein